MKELAGCAASGPIAEGMYRLLYEQAGIGTILADLMTRHARYEVDDLP
jgi:hypothetical protein